MYLFDILPAVILYLTSGFAFLCGLYLWIDRRFNLLSDVSFTIMLVIGYLLDTIVRVIPFPKNIQFTNEKLRNLILVIVSCICGMIFAFLQNKIGTPIISLVIKMGRRKTLSESFWYNVLDEKDKPMWVRLVSYNNKYVLEGVLLSLAESEDNPYFLLGYCKKYNLDGTPIENENVNSNDKFIQKVVRPDSFDELTLIYSKDSLKAVELNVE